MKIRDDRIRTMTHEEWCDEGERRFGKDPMNWRFVCPVCKHVATPQDWRAAGAGDGEVAFSCIGRHVKGARGAFEATGQGPCTYAGGGLFKLNPVKVVRDGKVSYLFAFAEEDADG